MEQEKKEDQWTPPSASNTWDNVTTVIGTESTPNKDEQGENKNDFASWEEIKGMLFKSPVAYVDGMITEGFTILAAKPKQGKSTLINNLILSVAAGTKAFGELDVTQTEIALLALETSPRRLQCEIQKMSLDNHQALSKIHTRFTWNPDISLYAGLSSILKNNPKIGIVVIDTIGRFLDSGGGTKSGYEKRYQVGAVIKDVADEFNIAIIGLHHLKKGSVGDTPVDSILGSSGLPAAADNIITLQRSRNTGLTKLEVTGRNIDESQYQLKFTEETRSFKLIRNHSEVTLGRETKDVLQYLKNCEAPQTLKEVMAHFGKERTAVSNLLKTLVDRNLVHKPSHGKYEFIGSSEVSDATNTGDDQ